MNKRFKKDNGEWVVYASVIGFGCLAVLFKLALWCGLIYAAYHFISKHW